MKLRILPVTFVVLILGSISGLLLGILLEDSSPTETQEVSEYQDDTSTVEDSSQLHQTYEEIIEDAGALIDKPVAAIDESLSADVVAEDSVNKPLEEGVSGTLETEVKIEAWQAASLAFDLENVVGKPVISIIIDDVGVAQKWSRKATALPGPMTMAFIPYGRNLKEHVETARSNGHEIMLHLPMEPTNPEVDPGENALYTHHDGIELIDRLLWNLSQIDGYMGINNHMGSKFTADERVMRLVLNEVKLRGLAFIDSITSGKTVGYKLAEELNIPHATRDVFLDHDMSEEAITKQLKRTEKIAKKQGYAIAIGHPHENTIKVLTKWVKDVEGRGFALVPASVIIKMMEKKKASVLLTASEASN